MFMVSFTGVQYWFDKRKATATGFVTCGSGAGTIIFSSVTQKLLDAAGWRNTMRFRVGIYLINVST